jgi:hypothetical protein
MIQSDTGPEDDRNKPLVLSLAFACPYNKRVRFSYQEGLDVWFNLVGELCDLARYSAHSHCNYFKVNPCTTFAE